jgi:integrase
MALGSIDRITSDRTGKVSYRARWEFIDDRGKRRHRSECFATKKQAQDKLASVQHKLRAGSYIEASDEPFGQFVTRYLNTMRHRWRRPSTYDRMARCWSKMAQDALKDVPLAKLHTSQIQRVYDDLSQRGYSSSAVLLLHTFLCGALDAAIREGLLATNPAKGATLPKRTRHIPVTWDRAQVMTFLAAIKAREDAALWTVFVYTGLRIGEVIGLRWEDVDFDRGTLMVRRTASRNAEGKRVVLDGAKTASSNRLVVLPKPCVSALKWHRQITDGDGWVFAGTDGQPLTDMVIRGRLETLMKQTGLPRLTPHGFRHTAATLALTAGVHPKLVQEMLGHKSVAITLDLYSHVGEGLKRAAAEQLDAFLAEPGQQHEAVK